MQFFRPYEFECHCGKCGKGYANMDPSFLERLDFARGLSPIKFRLTSAARCSKHNQAVGGLDNSAHLKGLAVDIQVRNSKEHFEIMRALIRGGFDRIGQYVKNGKGFIHVDMDESKPPRVLF